MKKAFKSSGLFIYFFATLLLLEVALRLSTLGTLSPRDLIYPILFSIPISLILCIVSTLPKGRGRFFISFFAILSISFLFASQIVYYKFFKTFYTLYSASNGGQILEFWRDILVILKKVWPWLIVVIIPIILFPFLKGRVLFISRPGPLGLMLLSVLFILSNILIFVSIYLAPGGPNSPYNQVFLRGSPAMAIEKLGLPTVMVMDGVRLMLGESSLTAFANINDKIRNRHFANRDGSLNESTELEDLNPIGPVIKNGNDTGGPHSPEPRVSGKSPRGNPKYKSSRKPNILDIDFDNLIASEDNEDIRGMHKYFSSVHPTYKNKYTGKYQGYNLVLITAESFSPYAIHEDVTPTLYKMVHEGFSFKNFYNPIWEVSTLDGEYVACTGLLPKPGVWSFYKSGNIYLPFVMGNQLKALGYKTLAYHNHTYDYYRRDISHPNMGYEYKGIGNGLILPDSWPRSDLEMMEKTLPEYIHNEPFHAYYMTVSGHMQYNFFGNHMSIKNREVVKNLPYTEAGRAYIATQVELDRAMELLLKELEDAGIANKTLIAISGDHYPYGLEKSELEDLAGHSLDEDFELYRSTFILYTKDMEPVTIDKPCSSLDIIPTLSNLLGLEYDSRLLMGRDILSDSKALVVFLNRSFITELGRYNSVKDEFIPVDGTRVDETYIENMLESIEEKFYYSAKILDNDYYKSIP